MTETVESLRQELDQVNTQLTLAKEEFSSQAKISREKIKSQNIAKGTPQYTEIDNHMNALLRNKKTLEIRAATLSSKLERMEQAEKDLAVFTNQQELISNFFSQVNTAREITIDTTQKVAMNTFLYAYQLVKLLPKNIHVNVNNLLLASFLIDLEYSLDTVSDTMITIKSGAKIELAELIKVFGSVKSDLKDVGECIKAKDNLKKWIGVFGYNYLDIFNMLKTGVGNNAVVYPEEIIITTAHYLAQKYPFNTTGKWIFLNSSIKFLEPSSESILDKDISTERSNDKDLDLVIKLYNQLIITYENKLKRDLLGDDLLSDCKSAKGVGMGDLKVAYENAKKTVNTGREWIKHLSFDQFIQLCDIPQTATNDMQLKIYNIQYPEIRRDFNLIENQFVSTVELEPLIPEIQEWIHHQLNFLKYIKAQHPEVFAFFTSDVTKGIESFPSDIQSELSYLFERAPRTPNMILWRGEQTNWWGNSYELIDRSFTSTSLGVVTAVDYASCCLKKIYVAKGSVAFLIPNLRGLFEILLPFNSHMTPLNIDTKSYSFSKLFEKSGIEVKQDNVNKILEVFTFKYSDIFSADPFDSDERYPVKDDGYTLLTVLASRGLNSGLTLSEAQGAYKIISESHFFSTKTSMMGKFVYKFLVKTLHDYSTSNQDTSAQTTHNALLKTSIKLTNNDFKVHTTDNIFSPEYIKVAVNTLVELIRVPKTSILHNDTDDKTAHHNIDYEDDYRGMYDKALKLICDFGINAEIFHIITQGVGTESDTERKKMLQIALDGLSNSDDLLAVYETASSNSLVYNTICVCKQEHINLLNIKSKKVILKIPVPENTVINAEVFVTEVDLPHVVNFGTHVREIHLHGKLHSSQKIPFRVTCLHMSVDQEIEFPLSPMLNKLEIYGKCTKNLQGLIKNVASLADNSVISLGGDFNEPIGNLYVKNIQELSFGDAFNQDISGIYGGKIHTLSLGKSFNVPITSIDYKLEFLNIYNLECIKCELPDGFNKINAGSKNRNFVNFKGFKKQDFQNYKIFVKNEQVNSTNTNLSTLVSDFKEYIQSLSHHQGNLYQHSIWTAMYMQDMLKDIDPVIKFSDLQTSQSSDNLTIGSIFNHARVGVLSAMLHDIGKGGDNATDTPVKPGHEYMGARYLKRGLYYIRGTGYVNLDIMLTDLGCGNVEKLAIAMLTESHWKLGEAIIRTEFTRKVELESTDYEKYGIVNTTDRIVVDAINEVIELFIDKVLVSYLEWKPMLAVVSSDQLYEFLEIMIKLQFLLCIADVKGATAYCAREYTLNTKGFDKPGETFTVDCPFDNKIESTGEDGIINFVLIKREKYYPYFKYGYNFLLYDYHAATKVDSYINTRLIHHKVLDEFTNEK